MKKLIFLANVVVGLHGLFLLYYFAGWKISPSHWLGLYHRYLCALLVIIQAPFKGCPLTFLERYLRMQSLSGFEREALIEYNSFVSKVILKLSGWQPPTELVSRIVQLLVIIGAVAACISIWRYRNRRPKLV